MSHPRFPAAWFSVAARCAVFACASVTCALAGDGVSVREVEGRIRVEVDGKLFTEYHYQNTSRPFLYPILGPGGAPMSRNWPMKDAPNEERDHPHHKSLWWAHGAVNGVDFWSESDKAGRTVHEKFLEKRSSPDLGLIKSLNRLVAKDGRVVGSVEFTITIHRHREGPVLDWQTTVRASDGELRFGDTKEGTMAIRLNETMRLKANSANAGKPGGHIVNSEGVRDDATWGKQATWVDYHGPVEGRTLGVAILDHPDNPRHPTWWHVRDYGLFAANPFGIHDFEKKPAGAGDLVVPAGQSVTFRYRFVFHPGDEREAGIAARFQEYVNPAR